jgi:hypothetical protein
MRSIWYRLTQKPCNLDDCLDLADKAAITKCRLCLKYHDPIRQVYSLTQLLAQLEVQQGDTVRTIEELCGSYLDADSETKKSAEVARANTRLKTILSRLSRHGIAVSNSDLEFEYHSTP